MVHIEVERKTTSTTAFWSWVVFAFVLALVIWAVVELIQ